MALTVVQVLPALDAGGVERGTVEIARALVARGHRSIVVSGGGRLEQELAACGAEHINLPIGRKSVLTLRLIPRLRAVLRDCHADIVHARSRLPAWMVYLAWNGMDAATRPGFVTTVHGPYSVNPYSRIMIRGQRVIAISAFIHDYILSHYAAADPLKIITIPRGVDPLHFPHGYLPDALWLQDWRGEYPQLYGRYLITLPARITHWKGQRDFIQIIATLISSGLAIHGLIVGGTDTSRRGYFAELQSLMQRLGIEQHITFTGHRAA